MKRKYNTRSNNLGKVQKKSKIASTPSGDNAARIGSGSIRASAADVPFRPIIRVGLDNGTTRLAIFYSHITKKPNDEVTLSEKIRSGDLLTRWPNTLQESDYAAAESIYIHGEEAIYWGYGVESRRTAIHRATDGKNADYEISKMAKLLLHTSDRSKAETDQLKNMARRLGIEPLELMKNLDAAVIEFLIKYFKRFHLPWMQSGPLIQIKVGVPPAWTDAEHKVFFEIIQNASVEAVSKYNAQAQNQPAIDIEVSLGSEAEATTLTFAAMREVMFQVEDLILTLDAGGGTFDVVMYKVIGINPLRMQEQGIADSVLCGGVFIDSNVRNIVKNKYPNLNAEDVEKVVDFFQSQIKPTFDGIGGALMNDLRMNLTTSESTPRRDISIYITCDELKEHGFDPVITEMKVSIHRFLKRTENDRKDSQRMMIVFGGGVSANKYVVGELQTWIIGLTDLKNPFEFCELFSSIAPVAKGLLALAESNVVQSRSEKTLGFYELVAYNEEEHGDKLQCGALEDSIEEGKFYVGCISWIIYQSQIVPRDFTRRIPRQRVVQEDTTDMFEYFYESKLQPPSLNSYIIPPDTNAEEELKQLMNLIEYQLAWNFNATDKDLCFIPTIDRDGKPGFLIEWDIVIQLVNGVDIIISAEVKDKNGRILTTKPKPIGIELDQEDAAYIALGSLALQRPTNRY